MAENHIDEWKRYIRNRVATFIRSDHSDAEIIVFDRSLEQSLDFLEANIRQATARELVTSVNRMIPPADVPD